MLRWLTVLWPGLPQLWLRGDGSALILAMGFSALLNLAVVATWGWTELLTPHLLAVAWGGLVLFWVISLLAAVPQTARILRIPSPDLLEDLFRTAQREYLKGNWFEAELALNRLLEYQAEDLDAQLMLATLLRRIGQSGEAGDRLQRMETFEGASKWQLEIARERRLLQIAVDNTAQNVQLNEPGIAGLPSAA